MARITLEPGGAGLRIGAVRITWTLRYLWHVCLSLGAWRLYEQETFYSETEAKEAAADLARELAAWIGKTGQVEGTEEIEQASDTRRLAANARQRAYRQRLKERTPREPIPPPTTPSAVPAPAEEAGSEG